MKDTKIVYNDDLLYRSAYVDQKWKWIEQEKENSEKEHEEW